jgi:uncharacterized protein YyaL (SSP411 family)
MSKHRNALATETSPYLIQHAHNPVDWHSWNETALARARAEDKPILLSIGYSACHWCHVMAHESFEDEATASLMNRLFINIKVDREERPDLDKIYQIAHYLLTHNHGGWPLTMFLSPGDHAPFFGGTYFPKQARFGLPAFADILQRAADFYASQRGEIAAQSGRLRDALESIQETGTTDRLDAAPLRAARATAIESFDRTLGGFGPAPKFPHATTIEFLLRRYAASRGDETPDEDSRHMAVFTLACMARGGIYDHLGGGFCRYAVDDYWMIPHFEKMLYDNASLLALYSDAWRATGNALFRRTALETADFVMRDMQSKAGGFYSSLDADSEGEEGKYYVWTPEEVATLLDAGQYRLFAERYGLNDPANFERHWHLHHRRGLDTIAADAGMPVDTVRQVIDAARTRLLDARYRRTPPGRDDKCLTAWNALMIKSLAIAGRVFDAPVLVDAASRALDFVRGTLWRDRRLLATCKDGRAHLNAYLDDYAFLIDALLHLLQARWRDGDLVFAIDLADALLMHFEDRERGGFFFVAHDHETLLLRSKTFQDDATPAGNGIAALVLNRLGLLLGDPRYIDASARCLRAGGTALARYPFGHCTMLMALEEHLDPPQTIVLRGDVDALREWQAVCHAEYAPRRLVFAIPDTGTALPGLLGTKAVARGPVAYVCTGTVCAAPIHDVGVLRESLER